MPTIKKDNAAALVKRFSQLVASLDDMIAEADVVACEFEIDEMIDQMRDIEKAANSVIANCRFRVDAKIREHIGLE